MSARPQLPSSADRFVVRMATVADASLIACHRRLMFEEMRHASGDALERVMRFIIDWCRDEGLACVQLHASDDGRPLYESLGFLATNELRLAF